MRGFVVAIIACIFALPAPLCAQSEFMPPKGDSPAYSKTLLLSPFVFDIRNKDKFGRWFNSRVIISRRDDKREKEELREKWEEFLGIDVFYPYFKAKQVQEYVKDKTRVEFFKFKGRAEFEEGSGSVRYIFKKKF